MKCSFRFEVRGRLRLASSGPVPTELGVYDFVIRDGKVIRVDVTVTLSREEWPEATPSPGPGIPPHINTNCRKLPAVQDDIRSLQGLLAFFGLESIDWQQPEVVWLAETAEEQAALQVHSWKVTIGPDENTETVSFDLIARAALAARGAHASQVPLNFFRRAMRDVVEQQYVDAIYDFYFVLETLYAEGKHRTAEVKRAFKASAGLMAAIQRALAKPPPIGQNLTAAYVRRFGALTPEAVVDHLVDTRGRLHHHSLQDTRRHWNPEYQREHHLDSILFQDVALEVLWEFVEKSLYEPTIIAAYESLRQEHSQGQVPSDGSEH